MNGRREDNKQKSCKASLSTMWVTGKPGGMWEFIRVCQQLGFAGIELNYQINSAMMADIDWQQVQVTSVHEPCPADISVPMLKARNWLISSEDEECRRQGVQAIQRSIDLASSLGARAVVIHAGTVEIESPLEKELEALYRAGQVNSEKFLELKNALIKRRAARVGPRLEAVRKSLAELLDHALPMGVRLGLENRYHYMDIPLPEEMDHLLRMAEPEQLGMWYDVGHAQALDRLGFYAHTEWLQRFGSRMVGVHLHDVVGIDDHRAPGTGEVDFSELAPYLPADVIHTFELREDNTPEQIRTGLHYLVEKGCVRC